MANKWARKKEIKKLWVVWVSEWERESYSRLFTTHIHQNHKQQKKQQQLSAQFLRRYRPAKWGSKHDASQTNLSVCVSKKEREREVSAALLAVLHSSPYFCCQSVVRRAYTYSSSTCVHYGRERERHTYNARLKKEGKLPTRVNAYVYLISLLRPSVRPWERWRMDTAGNKSRNITTCFSP